MKKQLISLVAVAATVGGFAAFTNTGADATVTQIGSCSGMTSVAKVTPSLGNTNQAVTISAKGNATGSCSISAPATGGGTIAKWGLKTTSPVADCIPDVDAAEYAQNGKISITFSASKLDGYVRTEQGANLTDDFIVVTGISTKGAAVGATIGGTLYIDPVIKLKGATDLPANPGYAFDLGAALGCTDGTGATAANITGVAIGDGPSPLLSTATTGLTLSFGN